MPNSAYEQLDSLKAKLEQHPVPQDLRERIELRLEQMKNLADSPSFFPEFDRMDKYVQWVTTIPWETKTQDVLDLVHARQVLDQNHHGLDEIKDRVLEHLAVMKLKHEKGEDQEFMRAPILCFVGLVGTGKTTIAISIAEALGRKFVRIPFGGMGDPRDLRGHSRMFPEAEPGKVVKALVSAGARNIVILLDEIDRVTEEGRASLMGVLVELLDPKQNKEFVDHYIDYPVDLSDVLFVATANNTHNIATAVMDRLEPIQMTSYTDEDKITIAKKYMLPKVLKESGLTPETLIISDDVWPNIVRPLGYDSGMRTLERTIQKVARKVARMIVEGQAQSVTITAANIKQFVV